MLIPWQTGSVHHKILIFCCFDFSAGCLSNGTTGCTASCPAPPWATIPHLAIRSALLLLFFLCRQPRRQPQPQPPPQPQPEDRQTPESAAIHEFSFLLGFFHAPLKCQLCMWGDWRQTESESELDLDLGILRQAVLSYSLDRHCDIPARKRQPDDRGVWDETTAGDDWQRPDTVSQWEQVARLTDSR